MANNGLKKKLAKKLLTRILLVSTLVTTLFTGISFYIDYRAEMDSLSTIFNQIEVSSIKNISTGVYNFNDDRVKLQINGLIRLPGIQEVVVTDDNDTIFSETRHPEYINEHLLLKEYSLFHEANNEKIFVGHARITATKFHMFKRLKDKVLYFFLFQGMKTFMVSFIILMIFEYYVTSHIRKMYKFFSQYNSNQENILKLRRSNKDKDELDYLCDSINKMNQVVQSNLRKSEEAVEEHKLSAIHSAKMASIGEMAGGVAHEINNPLTVIKGTALKIRRKTDDEDVHDLCQDINTTVERITKIIRGLKKLSRNEEEGSFDEVIINNLIEETISLCEEKIKYKKVRLTINKKLDVEILECRWTEISQVLLNLIGNACDAIDELDTRWIRLDVTSTNKYLEVRVTDSGEGITSIIKEKIFEPFFTTKKLGVGTGLGLSISRQLIEGHNGVFYLDETSKNTSFIIKIPLKHSDSGFTKNSNKVA